MSLLTAHLKTALELINATAGIDELLLARKERVALRADINTNLTVGISLGRTRLDSLTASAADSYLFILRMYSGLHIYYHSFLSLRAVHTTEKLLT